MAKLIANKAEELLATCKQNEADIASALSRALDGDFDLALPDSTSLYRKSYTPEEWNGPGLAIVFTFVRQGVLAIVPESGGVLPEWYAEPDPTGTSKLATLGQELSMLLVPEEYLADEYQAQRVEHLAEAIERGKPADDAALIRLSIQSDGKQALLDLIWPFESPQEILADPDPDEAAAPAESAPADKASPAATSNKPSAKPAADSGDLFDRLPPYIRSMLKMEVPVRVTLAAKKQSVQDILALTPGSIINFDKSCDQLLDLEVGECRIAQGEAVKVGDKFGLRIGTVVLPEERFAKLCR